MEKRQSVINLESTIKPNQLKGLANQVTEIMSVLQLQNHTINFVPSLRELKEGNKDLASTYNALYEFIDNLYLINQDLITKADEAACLLMEYSTGNNS